MPEVLSTTTVKILNRQLLAMARRLVLGAEVPVAQLSLEPWDQRYAMHDWSVSQSPPLPECRVEDLFVQQATRSPSQSAVILGQEMLSYGQLLQASRDFARVLMSERTADLPFVVAVLSERCMELPMALLSVLMAGGSFVPLSPEFPVERLRFMASEAEVGLLAVSAALEKLGNSLGLPMQVIPCIKRMGTGSQKPFQRRKLQPTLAAYVIFTSGSTGKPKGVKVSQRALLSHLIPYIQVLRLGCNQRVLLTSSFTFDMAYSQIFGALLSGACLVVTNENPMIDPLELLEVLQNEQISFCTLVPSVISSMVHLKKTPFSLPALRHLGCGGEALKSAAADFLRSCTSAVQTPVLLHNRYGPTECAINALLFGPMEPSAGHWENVPIGWPSGHRHVAIDSMRLDGPGELILAGLGVALGYAGATDQATAFQENLRGAGLEYHTGDVACRVFSIPKAGGERTNGCVRFIGRRDSQVKLQGQRIELSEIEETICQVADVEACVVILAGSALVAFVSPAIAAVKEMVRFQCEKLLPRAMIPQIQLLDLSRWPRTSSAKIDRLALVELSPQENNKTVDQGGSGSGSIGILMEAGRKDKQTTHTFYEL